MSGNGEPVVEAVAWAKETGIGLCGSNSDFRIKPTARKVVRLVGDSAFVGGNSMLESFDIPSRDSLTGIDDKPIRFEPVELDIDTGLWWWHSGERCGAACDPDESAYANSSK